MKNIVRFALLVFVVAAISSCSSKAPKQIKYIPKEASFVFGISPQRLQEKLEKGHVNFDSLMRQAMSSSGSDSSSITMEDLKNSGIDFTEDFYVFVNQRGSIMTPRSTETGVIGVLKSASSFEAFLKKQKKDVQIQKAKEYSYAVTKDGSVVGWKDDIFIVTDISGNGMSYNDNNSNPSTSQSLTMLSNLFDLKESASIADIKEFRELANGSSDMLFWTNSSSTMASIPFVGMTKAADLFKDAFTAGTLNFEDGKVEMDTKSYVGKDLKEILDRHAGPKVNMDMVVRYPYPVNGFSAFSFDPKLITDILKYVGADQTANQFLQEQGLTLDDVTSAFAGDFAVVFSNFGMTEKSNPQYPEMKVTTPDAKLLINAKVGNVNAYHKVMNALVQKGFLSKQGDEYVLNQSNPDMNVGNGFEMSADDRNVLVATGRDLITAYKQGNGKANIPNDVRDMSNSRAVVFYVDIAGILNAMPRDTAASLQDSMMSNARKTFKDVIITGDNFDGKSIHGVFELRTTNDKENSLATLVNYFSSTASSFKKMENVEVQPDMDEPSSDSAEDDDTE